MYVIHSSHTEGDRVNVIAADPELPLLLTVRDQDSQAVSVFLTPRDVDRLIDALYDGRDV